MFDQVIAWGGALKTLREKSRTERRKVMKRFA